MSTHHVNKQLPQGLQNIFILTFNDILLYMHEFLQQSCKFTSCKKKSFVLLTFPSTRAHKSQTAFRMAAVASWITPFSGPICQWDHLFIQLYEKSWSTCSQSWYSPISSDHHCSGVCRSLWSHRLSPPKSFRPPK